MLPRDGFMPQAALPQRDESSTNQLALGDAARKDRCLQRQVSGLVVRMHRRPAERTLLPRWVAQMIYSLGGGPADDRGVELRHKRTVCDVSAVPRHKPSVISWHRWTPGLPALRSAPHQQAKSAIGHHRLKIVVSPVRVRVSPSQFLRIGCFEALAGR